MAAAEVIIADDNPRDRRFLADLLSDYRVIEVVNGAEALAQARDRDEPWIVADLQMPQMNGIELARALWRERPAARIVFWSQFKDEMYVRSLARIIPAETVYGYVLKDNTAETLGRAVQAVFQESQCWIDPKLRPVQARVTQGAGGISDVEYEALVDIALGLTDNMIALRRYLSRRGVQNRLKSLYAKLGVDQDQFSDSAAGEGFNLRTRAIATALRRGLVNPFELTAEEEKLQAWLKTARQP